MEVPSAAENLLTARQAGTAERDALSNDNLPAAFWDALPTNEEHPDLRAIRALQEESTPEERADTLKDQGNELFMRGIQLKKKFYLHQALAKYTEGVELRCGDAHLASTLLSNRAQCHLRLGNNRSALNDSVDAMQASPENVKAAFRGAIAAVRLQAFDKAAELCERGLKCNPEASELKTLQKDVGRRAKQARDDQEKEAARQLAIRAPARKLAIAMHQRGYKVGAPQLSVGNRKPYLDQEGLLHWPVLFMYPEVMQNDVVEDVAEPDTLKEHLDVIFAADAEPLPWDAEGAYTRERIELYYLSNAAQPLSVDKLTEALHGGWPEGFTDQGPQRYGPKASRAVLVHEQQTLQEVLSKADHVVPGVPLFFVVASGTDAQKHFLDAHR